jgi:hypothetical protein
MDTLSIVIHCYKIKESNGEIIDYTLGINEKNKLKEINQSNTLTIKIL